MVSEGWKKKIPPHPPLVAGATAATFYESTAVKLKCLFFLLCPFVHFGAFLPRLGVLRFFTQPQKYCDSPCPHSPPALSSRCLEKRSRALQGCNPTRNIQVDGAERASGSGGLKRRGRLLATLGHRSHASKTQPPLLSSLTGQSCPPDHRIFVGATIESPRL
jgi:hypothetical protein